ncbi:WD40 repeat domain-containing protein [Roseateles noduli]|uniref:WD40 repeat domain-containing protein n=1 Tax=Roseateles noduli TaxID=2052484 RepID=UPI003D656B4F
MLAAMSDSTPPSRLIRVGKSFQLRFTADGDHVIAVGRDIVVWSLRERQRVGSIRPFAHPAYLDISPCGDRVVVKNTAGRLAILSAAHLELIALFPADQTSEGCQPLFSPCGTRIVDGSGDGALRVLDGETGEVVHQELSAGVMINALACDARRSLYSYVKQRKCKDRDSALPFSQIMLRRWPFEDHSELELPVGAGYVNAATPSPDGSRLAVIQMNTASEMSLQVVDLSTGRCCGRRSILFGGTAWSLGWSPDGTRLCCVERGQLSVFDSSSLRLVGRYIDPYPCSVEFSSDGGKIAIGSWEKGTILGTDQIEAIPQEVIAMDRTSLTRTAPPHSPTPTPTGS